MIITKANKIKELERDIQHLEYEIKISDIILRKQSEIIETLTKKTENQRKEINNLHKWIKKNEKLHLVEKNNRA